MSRLFDLASFAVVGLTILAAFVSKYRGHGQGQTIHSIALKSGVFGRALGV